ncbi:hypothetical protein EVAR_64000_1 [Eumeta japonica]|uniref:Uncharacterized protein n=1 Tax=Eumeta variegata TaxID=151549 RepID=A0A4C1Z2Q7_EUMVA|nr:hypothetical protein EVAR_64000_1 [Eumeta japonica]
MKSQSVGKQTNHRYPDGGLPRAESSRPGYAEITVVKISGHTSRSGRRARGGRRAARGGGRPRLCRGRFF